MQEYMAPTNRMIREVRELEKNRRYGGKSSFLLPRVNGCAVRSQREDWNVCFCPEIIRASFRQM